MKNLKLAAAVVCAMPLFLSGSSPAQQQNATFEFAFCNMSDFSGVFVALTHKQNVQKWTASGWYAIPDLGCTFVGSFLRDTIYYYAESTDGSGAVWNGAETDRSAKAACIDHDKLFQGAVDVSSCPAGQDRVNFRSIRIPATLPRLTWTITGSR